MYSSGFVCPDAWKNSVLFMGEDVRSLVYSYVVVACCVQLAVDDFAVSFRANVSTVLCIMRYFHG